MRFDISANRLVSRRVEECTVGDVRRFASVLLTCLAFAAFLLICLAVALARTVSAATTISSPQSTIASVQASSQVAAASNLIPGAKGLHVKNAQGRSKPQ